MIITAGVGAAVGGVLARRAVSPLTAVSAAARRVARGELAARPQVLEGRPDQVLCGEGVRATPTRTCFRGTEMQRPGPGDGAPEIASD